MQPARRKIVFGLPAALAFNPQFALAGAKKFRLGLTPVFLNNDREVLDATQKYIQEYIGGQIEFVQRRTYEEITNLLLLGDLDAAWICGYPYLQHKDDLSVVAVPVWRGAALYQAYTIVGSDSTAKHWEDLRGGLHAYSDPDSNSGYLVTVSELIRRNHKPETFFERTIFTFGHRNVVRAVASRLTDSGSVDGYVWEALSKIEPELTTGTRVIWKSEKLGFPPIACRKELAATDEMQAFRKALFEMHKNDTGKTILDQLQIDKFQHGEEQLFDGIAARMKILADRA